jgi:U4/U6.U5 tri-snRNP-associated protein 3
VDKDWDKEREKRKKEMEVEVIMSGEGPVAAALTEKDLEGKTEEEIEMMKIMGFSGFDTSKGKKVRNMGKIHKQEKGRNKQK